MKKGDTVLTEESELQNNNRQKKAVSPWCSDDIDGGYSWVILFVTFCTFSLSLGSVFGIGVLYSQILIYYDTQNSVGSWIPLLQRGIGTVWGLLAGALIKWFGLRFVMCTGAFLTGTAYSIAVFVNNIYLLIYVLGFIAGIGISQMFVASLVCIQLYFVKKRPMANGIGVSGVGVGMIIFPFIDQVIISRYGLKAALMFHAAITIQGVFLGMLLRPHQLQYIDNNKENLEKSGKNKIIGHFFRRKLCLKVPFLLYVVGFFLLQSGHITPPTYLVDRALELRISLKNSALLIMCMGITNTLCRVFTGLIGSKTVLQRQISFASCLLIAGVFTLISTQLDSFEGLLVYAIFFGIFKGCYQAQYAGVMVDIVGVDNVSYGMGVVVTINGLATFVGVSFAGWLADQTGSYVGTLLLSGICQTCGSIFLYLIPIAYYLDNKSGGYEPLE